MVNCEAAPVRLTPYAFVAVPPTIFPVTVNIDAAPVSPIAALPAAAILPVTVIFPAV